MDRQDNDIKRKLKSLSRRDAPPNFNAMWQKAEALSRETKNMTTKSIFWIPAAVGTAAITLFVITLLEPNQNITSQTSLSELSVATNTAAKITAAAEENTAYLSDAFLEENFWEMGNFLDQKTLTAASASTTYRDALSANNNELEAQTDFLLELDIPSWNDQEEERTIL